jgi:hypothetical protein
MRWIFALVLLLVSCLDKPDCISQADNALLIAFKKVVSNGVVADTVVLYHIVATGADSVFYRQHPVDVADTLKGTPATLTLNPFADSTEFVFKFPLEEKVLLLRYQRSFRFINENCFSELRIHNLEVVFSEFDSVRIVQPTLTKTKTVNLEVFR